MHLNLAEGTSQAHLDGTTTGIVVTIVVMIPALAFFIALIYWSARPTGAKKGHLQPALSQASAGAAGQPVTSASGHGAPRPLVDHLEHNDGTSPS